MYQHGTLKLGQGIKNWLADEAGNTTVDWVVLLSGIVGMTFAVMVAISGGVNTFGDKAETELSQRDLGYTTVN